MKKRLYCFVALLVFVCSLGLSGCTKRIDAESAAGLEAAGDLFAEDGGNNDGWMPDDDKSAQSDGELTGKDNERAAILDEAVPTECYVHITGAVNNPGVYKALSTDRVYSIVYAAGGLREDACENYINQALLIEDGLMIWVPTRDEADRLSENPLGYIPGDGQSLNDTDQQGQQTDKDLININTADIPSLCNLSGIGESKAKAIIEYRQKIGGFSSLDQLMDVSGIGQGSFDKIKDQICL